MHASVAAEAGTLPAPAGRVLDSQACLRILSGLLASALVILWLGRYTNIDLWLADTLYDHATSAFPWRDAWLTATFGHRILKSVLLLAGSLAVAAALLDTLRPRLVPRQARLALRVTALAALCVPLAVGTLKQASDSHCPWDLARYGGDQPYVRLFEPLPAGASPGHCLPAGHASSGLWLVALAVFWLPHRPRTALVAASAALAFGAALGWMQQLRGAHFLTHTLWSMWISCAVVLMLVMGMQAVTGTHAQG